MFNPRNIEVGCLVVICRKVWNGLCLQGLSVNLWKVEDTNGLVAKIVNDKNQTYQQIDNLIRCPLKGDIVRVYRPENINEMPGWRWEMKEFIGKDLPADCCTQIIDGSPIFDLVIHHSYSFHPWWLLPVGEEKEVIAVSIDKGMYPHTCPKCGSPAYIGLFKIECSKCK